MAWVKKRLLGKYRFRVIGVLIWLGWCVIGMCYGMNFFGIRKSIMTANGMRVCSQPVHLSPLAIVTVSLRTQIANFARLS